ncbi:RNA polymerase sigma factor [Paenibacillus arenilitoris]|uniref:RNA polymerase sigma factor n=1 Tax=Paenibacillus arenilitoris TaxID=2772299 RepID=A0A927CP91_9BACL|nr:RNA polymerase sigma factor [Paenibacillus arenilitoris]MBD2871649.1 RNA polymerase sigma factor [Paenibacillus arenilitoris]
MKQPFIDLYDQYFDDLYRYVYYKVGNKWDADDIVSEAFRKAYERHSTLRENSNAKAWLMTIARNAVIDFYRRRKPAVPVEQLNELAQPGAFEEQFAPDDDLDCVRKTLDLLTQEDRELVNLRYFAGMKNREIGEMLAKSEETIKTRVFRLLKKMNILVTNCLEGARKHE